MKISSTILAAIVLSSILPESHAFQSAAPITATRTRTQDTHIFSTPSAEDIKRIMQEESTNPASKYVYSELCTVFHVYCGFWHDMHISCLCCSQITTILIPYITIALADSAAAMKNMTPEDMGKLISEMEGMPEAQKAQLKDMGMDPDTSEYVVCAKYLYFHISNILQYTSFPFMKYSAC